MRLIARRDHRLPQIHRACAAFRPMVGPHGVFRTRLNRQRRDQFHFPGRIV